MLSISCSFFQIFSLESTFNLIRPAIQGHFAWKHKQNRLKGEQKKAKSKKIGKSIFYDMDHDNVMEECEIGQVYIYPKNINLYKKFDVTD